MVVDVRTADAAGGGARGGAGARRVGVFLQTVYYIY
jgi:hypothetical protein